MYRSFVTCDDPKGVVECGTIRKSKIASQKTEGKKKSHRTTDKGKREEIMAKENARDYPSPCSFQLLEVSRGAQKLNHLIDSWSKGLSYDGQPKDIAKELLKGALDLQESLTMLGKLQEASQYVSQLKKKHKEKVERGSTDHVWCERSDSDRFGFQNPRLSADGSSRDCIEELRNAIRDGLARQNLLANTSSQEKIRSRGRKMESSTSSTHSVHSTGSSISETALQNKGKAPNLIAKLMGLDYIPSKPLMQPPQKQLDMEKVSSPKRPVFEIEMPKTRKPQAVPQKVDSERRTLKEVLETVQFQGLLKGTSAVEHKSHSHQSSNFSSKQKLIDDVHPIVLIKPLRDPCFDSEQALATIVREERGLNTKMMLRKMSVNQVTSNASKMHFKDEKEEIPIERVIQEEGAKDPVKLGMMPAEKEVRTVEHSERAANMKNVHRKQEAEKAQVKRLSHEEGARDRKEVTPRAEEKEAKKKWKDSSLKMKSSNLAAHRQQKEETTDKKADNDQKLVSSSKKQVEKEALKAKIASKSDDQTKLTSTRLRKPENRSVPTNEHISLQHNTAQKINSKQTTESSIYSSRAWKQKEVQSSENTVAGPVIEDLDCKEEEKRIDLTCKNHSVKEESTINPGNETPMEGKVNASGSQTQEDCANSQSSLCKDATLSSNDRKDDKCFDECDDEMAEIRVDGTILISENQLKDFLLSSPTFLNLAEELFNLNLSYPKISLASAIHDQGVTDANLSLDYAKEYIRRRSLPDSQTRHPPLCYIGNSRIHISIDQLVEEVCRVVETLRSYRKLARDNLRADSLYATLENDMMCKGVVSGIWDLGWRNGFSADEVELAVNDLEKLLVSELIGEVFS